MKEIDTPHGYAIAYSEDGFTITNTYRPQAAVSKVNTTGSKLTGASLAIYEADIAGRATDTTVRGKDGEELDWVTTGDQDSRSPYN